MRALLSRRYRSTSLAPMRAFCTAATWRASNSDWVIMSPFTRTITRSTRSAYAIAPSGSARLRLSRTGLSRFMVHLRAGHEARDEFALRALLLVRQEPRADAGTALFEVRIASGRTRVDAQHVLPEAGRHHVAGLAGRQRERGRL